MTGPGRRFDPAELRGDGLTETDAEVADVLVAARELEALAARDVVVPTPEFDDRVMAAIALEAPPRVVVAGGTGLTARVAGFWGAVGSAWRVATSGGHPARIRAQALAFVLLVVLATGSLASVAAIGAVNLLDQPNRAAPTVAPAPTRTPEPTISTQPTAPTETLVPSEEPTSSVSPDPSESPEATETPESTDDHGGASPTKTPKPTAKPTKTPRPTRTPRATETPEPDESEEPDGSDDHGGGSGEDHGGSGSD